jgi:ATP-binding cassette, subfamily B, bacterial MsbA
MTVSAPSTTDADPKVNATVVYRRLLGYARPWLGLFMIGVLGMVIYAAAEASIVWFVDKFLEHAFVDPDPRVVWAVPLGAFLVFLFRGIGDYLATYFPGRVGRHVVQSIRADLFAQYLHLPASYYDRESTGKMLSRLVFDAEQVAEATTNSVTVDHHVHQVLAVHAAGACSSADHRLGAGRRQSAFSQVQRAHPAVHGRIHARGQGVH